MGHYTKLTDGFRTIERVGFTVVKPTNKNKKTTQKNKKLFDKQNKQRAFRLAMEKVWFNPDLDAFLTLTYKNQHKDYEKIKNDIKNLLTKKHRKYVGVVERHKKGNLHIHLLVNYDSFSKKNKKRINSRGELRTVQPITDWRQGFSDIQKITAVTDEKFKVYLYLFKYLNKDIAKVGGRYVLTSRNLLKNVKRETINYTNDLSDPLNPLIIARVHAILNDEKTTTKSLLLDGVYHDIFELYSSLI